MFSKLLSAGIIPQKPSQEVVKEEKASSPAPEPKQKEGGAESADKPQGRRDLKVRFQLCVALSPCVCVLCGAGLKGAFSFANGHHKF